MAFKAFTGGTAPAGRTASDSGDSDKPKERSWNWVNGLLIVAALVFLAACSKNSIDSRDMIPDMSVSGVGYHDYIDHLNSSNCITISYQSKPWFYYYHCGDSFAFPTKCFGVPTSLNYGVRSKCCQNEDCTNWFGFDSTEILNCDESKAIYQRLLAHWGFDDARLPFEGSTCSE